jgi:2-oxoglutarate dehydrogenase E1 component
MVCQPLDLVDFRIWGQLEDTFAKSKDYKPTSKEWITSSWNGFASPKDLATKVLPHLPTSVELDTLKEIGKTISTYPKDFNVHPNLKRIIASRGKSVIEDTGVDMSTAEALAFGSLVKEGYHVRVSGQDVERGTFSQRHAVLHDQKTEKIYTPLMHIEGEKAGSFVICNSSLSEYGVLGFEYGYSLSSPEALVMCEMQFGDFANVSPSFMSGLTLERTMYY